jgi:tetratricopeptide (TPR) repeat protein
LVVVVLFIRGTTGELLGLAQGIYTLLVAWLMYETVEDFAQVERRERLELDPHAVNAMDFFSQGRAYEKRGQWAKALLHWRRAAGLSPANDAYPEAMAQACARIGRFEMALRYVGQAQKASRNPQDFEHLREIIIEMQDESKT